MPRLRRALALMDFAEPGLGRDGSREFEEQSRAVFLAPEATCTGAAQSSYVTNNQCTFTATTFKSDFVSEVNENGSGHSTSHGTVAPEDWCLANAQHPADATGVSFRSGHTVGGSCGTVSNATVAVNPMHEHLSCGDSVYIVGVGVKTVTDR